MAFEFRKGDDPQFTCKQCAKTYCLNCRAVFHKGQTCEEYKIASNPDEADKAFEQFVQG